MCQKNIAVKFNEEARREKRSDSARQMICLPIYRKLYSVSQSFSGRFVVSPVGLVTVTLQMFSYNLIYKCSLYNTKLKRVQNPTASIINATIILEQRSADNENMFVSSNAQFEQANIYYMQKSDNNVFASVSVCLLSNQLVNN